MINVLFLYFFSKFSKKKMFCRFIKIFRARVNLFEIVIDFIERFVTIVYCGKNLSVIKIIINIISFILKKIMRIFVILLITINFFFRLIIARVNL